jgi:hypothetical protein
MIYSLSEFQANLHILRLQSSAAWKPFPDFETRFIGFGVKNRFRGISNFLNLDYFEKIQIFLIIIIYGNFDFGSAFSEPKV